MLESLLKNRELIERCLTRMRKFDMIPSLETWSTMEELVTFLRMLQKNSSTAECIRIHNQQHCLANMLLT